MILEGNEMKWNSKGEVNKNIALKMNDIVLFLKMLLKFNYWFKSNQLT